MRGKYRIDGVLGTGGMAVVYAATHRNRKRFAIKVLHPELSTRSEIQVRFVREGYLANSVGHPGVVSVLDDDVAEDGSAFLVMELLEGATLERLAAPCRPLPLRESLSLAIDVLDVLDAAHAKGIVHRDIKPANLFVTRLGELKVLDFGIARLRDATLSEKSTATGALLGTPVFMAPEQALALANEVDARTDLWAVGATVFTLLSGSFVHEGGSARQVVIRAATEPARSLISVAPDTPEVVSAWVSKALLFDKLARWESAAAMRAAAQQIYGDLFGESQERYAKCLFESQDIALLPTELSPTGALSSVVRETTRTTLLSFPGNPEASPSISELQSEVPPVRAHDRWRPIALLGGAALALGIALALAFARPTRSIESSLSAARPSQAAIITSSAAVSDVGSSLTVPPSPESPTPALPAMSSHALAPPVAPALRRATVQVSTGPKRSGPPLASARTQPAASPTTSAHAAELPTRAASAADRNPLQLEIQ